MSVVKSYYAGVGDLSSSLARLYSGSLPLRISQRRSGRAVGPVCNRRSRSVSVCGQSPGRGGAVVQDKKTWAGVSSSAPQEHAGESTDCCRER